MYGNGYGYGYGYGGWNRGYSSQPITSPQSPQGFNGYQGQMPQMEPQPQQGKPSLQVPWVNGEVGAQAYLIAPNSTVLLMDSDNPIFYIKTSDLSGKAAIKAFKYEELTQQTPQSSPMYVTREEFENFKKSLEKTEDQKI